MTANTSVSIVVNTYNRAESLRRTLLSFQQLDYPKFEVVVVNGPSTDSTEQVIAEFGGHIKVGSCPERNLSMSRNVGIALSDGEVVAFIDDDAYPDPGWLDSLIPAFDDHEVAGAGGPVFDHTGAVEQARYNAANALGEARIESEHNPSLLYNAPDSFWFPYPMGTNALFRRERLVEIGGFDEEFEYYLDETDVCRRLVDRGWIVELLDAGCVYHKFLASDRRTDDRAIRDRYTVLKNRTYFACKHGQRFTSMRVISQELERFFEQFRVDYRWNVDAGLLTEVDYEQFLRDCDRAFDVGMARFRAGDDRTRPESWFASARQPFNVFPTMRAAAEKLHVCIVSRPLDAHDASDGSHELPSLAVNLAAQGHVTRVLMAGKDWDRVDLEDGVWVHRLAEYATLPIQTELKRVAEIRPFDAILVSPADVSTIGVLDAPVFVDLREPGADSDRLRHLLRHAAGFLAADKEMVGALEADFGLRFPRELMGYVAGGGGLAAAEAVNRFLDRILRQSTAGAERPPIVRLANSGHPSSEQLSPGEAVPPDIAPHLRCPSCHSSLRVIDHVRTLDGTRKSASAFCDSCDTVAGRLQDFVWDFLAESTGEGPVDIGLREVPALGERRLGPSAPEWRLSGSWQSTGAHLVSEGGSDDLLTCTTALTDALVRLVHHPGGGLVEVAVDGVVVETVDLATDEGSYASPVLVVQDEQLARRSVTIRPLTSRGPSPTHLIVEELVVRGPLGPDFPPRVPINRGNPFSAVLDRWAAKIPPAELILEVGGGDRRRCQPNYFNFEFLPFELVDFRGDTHSLPFLDDTFAMVCSQAVFEHVRQPFEAAQELLRVTKPGGIVVTEVAFMQPLHAVPFHYFNMTPWGVQTLFADCEIIESDWFGDISFTVGWMLDTAGVTAAVGRERVDRVVAELADLERGMTHQQLKAVASGVYLVVRKPGGPAAEAQDEE